MSEEDQNPFVDNDEVLESDQTCWRDAARMCGEDCVAYDDKCESDPRWLPCTLLNLKRAQAKSFANIATELKRLNDRKDAADEEIRNVLVATNEHASKKAASEAYARKLKEMDPGPPEIK